MFRAVVFRGLSHGQSFLRVGHKGRNDIESGRYGMSWRSSGLAWRPLRMKAGCAHHG